METTRQQHMDWCKKRALEYVDRGDAKNAMMSLMSDLLKHPATENHGGIQLGPSLMVIGDLQDVHSVRKFIEGCN